MDYLYINRTTLAGFRKPLFGKPQFFCRFPKSDCNKEKRTRPAFYGSVGVGRSKRRFLPFAEVRPESAILGLGRGQRRSPTYAVSLKFLTTSSCLPVRNLSFFTLEQSMYCMASFLLNNHNILNTIAFQMVYNSSNHHRKVMYAFLMKGDDVWNM